MEMILANGKRVKVTMAEIKEFVSQMPTPIPNAYWRYSELLSEDEVMRFLKGQSSEDELKRIARYLLIYTENLSFTAYLSDKADGESERTREFNMPAINKLRELYQKVSSNRQDADGLVMIVDEMEKICLDMGADPL